ncbi:MAG: transcription initiation factor IIE, alpha subunit [halophilic archaeon J07HX64]|jgi:Transcription factor IIE (TFIIE), alpha subunit|nr:MAG: transcription initiation factor IIE, alpha subunit [halophilic archaeon J07HX64]
MYRLLETLEERHEYEMENEFYLCESCGIRFEFGEAMEFGFQCPECGTSVDAMENTRLVDAMESRIERLRDELNVESERVEA